MGWPTRMYAGASPYRGMRVKEGERGSQRCAAPNGFSERSVVAFMYHQLLNLIYILCVPAIALIAFLAGLLSLSPPAQDQHEPTGIFAHLRATAATKGRKFYLLALIWHTASGESHLHPPLPSHPFPPGTFCTAANCTNCALSQPMNWPPFIVTTVNKLHHRRLLRALHLQHHTHTLPAHTQIAPKSD